MGAHNIVTISIDGIQLVSSDEVILDFQWVRSRFVEAFPWLVIFTQRSAIVYHRSGIQIDWQPIAIISYKEEVLHMRPGAAINPHDAFPHLISGAEVATAIEQNRTPCKCLTPVSEDLIREFYQDELDSNPHSKEKMIMMYSWIMLLT